MSSLQDLGVSTLRQWMKRVPGPVLNPGLALAVAVVLTITIATPPHPGTPADALTYALGLIDRRPGASHAPDVLARCLPATRSSCGWCAARAVPG